MPFPITWVIIINEVNVKKHDTYIAITTAEVAARLLVDYSKNHEKNEAKNK